MAYNAGKNSYTVLCQEKKFYHQRFRKSKILTQTKSPLPPFRLGLEFSQFFFWNLGPNVRYIFVLAHKDSQKTYTS